MRVHKRWAMGLSGFGVFASLGAWALTANGPEGPSVEAASLEAAGGTLAPGASVDSGPVGPGLAASDAQAQALAGVGSADSSLGQEQAEDEPEPDNSGGGAPVPDEMLVKFRSGVDAETAQSLIAAQGGEVLELIGGIEVYRIRFDDTDIGLDERIGAFEANSGVEYAEPNHSGGGVGYVPNDPGVGNGQGGQWHLGAVNAPQAWDITRGDRNVRAAILDTGWQASNRDFSGPRFVPGPDVVNRDSDPEADHPHGVWTLGLMAGNADNNFNGVGIDHNMTATVVKTLNGQNASTDAELAAGIVAAANLNPRPHLMSLSLINYSNTAKTAVRCNMPVTAASSSSAVPATPASATPTTSFPAIPT